MLVTIWSMLKKLTNSLYRWVIILYRLIWFHCDIGLPCCTPELERRQYAVAFKNWMKKRMHNSKLLFRAMVKRRWCECVLLIGQTRNLPHHKAALTFFASVLAVLSPNSPWKVKAKAWKKPMPLIFHGLCTLWNLKIIGNLIKIYHTYFLAVSWKPSSKSASTIV